MQTERIPSFTPTPRKEQFRIQDPSKYDQTLNWSYCTSSKPTFLYWFSILHFYAPGNEYVLEIRGKKREKFFHETSILNRYFHINFTNWNKNFTFVLKYIKCKEQ